MRSHLCIAMPVLHHHPPGLTHGNVFQLHTHQALGVCSRGGRCRETSAALGGRKVPFSQFIRKFRGFAQFVCLQNCEKGIFPAQKPGKRELNVWRTLLTTANVLMVLGQPDCLRRVRVAARNPHKQHSMFTHQAAQSNIFTSCWMMKGAPTLCFTPQSSLVTGEIPPEVVAVLRIGRMVGFGQLAACTHYWSWATFSGGRFRARVPGKLLLQYSRFARHSSTRCRRGRARKPWPASCVWQWSSLRP